MRRPCRRWSGFSPTTSIRRFRRRSSARKKPCLQLPVWVSIISTRFPPPIRTRSKRRRSSWIEPFVGDGSASSMRWANEKLASVLQALAKRNAELERRHQEDQQTIQRLQRRLRSLLKIPESSPTQEASGEEVASEGPPRTAPRKRGAPVGHRGDTRHIPSHRRPGGNHSSPRGLSRLWPL